MCSQSWQPALRVQARRRLVQEEDLRVSRQRAGDRQPLALPAGELAHARVALLLERKIAQGFLGIAAAR